jgi:hypothetical protein
VRHGSGAARFEHNVTLPFLAFGTRANGTLFAHVYVYPSSADGVESALVSAGAEGGGGGGAAAAVAVVDGAAGWTAAGGFGGVALPREPPVAYVVVPLTRHLVPRAYTAKRLLGEGSGAGAAAAAAAANASASANASTAAPLAAAPPAAACTAPADGGAEGDAGSGSCANPDAAPSSTDAADADASSSSSSSSSSSVAVAFSAPPDDDDEAPWVDSGMPYTHMRPRITLRIAHPSPSLARCEKMTRKCENDPLAAPLVLISSDARVRPSRARRSVFSRQGGISG